MFIEIQDALISVLEALSQGGIGVFVSGLALIFMVFALIKMNSSWMIAAAFLTVPSTYMAGDWSGALLLVRLLPLTQLLAAYGIDKEESLIAWTLSMPTLLILAYSLFVITTSQAGFRAIEFFNR